MKFVETLPLYKEICSCFEQGKSVILSSARYYGARELAEAAALAHTDSHRATLAVVELRKDLLAGGLDYSAIAAQLAPAFNIRRFAIPADVSLLRFEKMLRAALVRRKQPVLLVLIGTRGEGEAYLQLLKTLHVLLQTFPFKRSGLAVLAVDDYSLLYQTQNEQPFSEMVQFKRLRFVSLTQDEIADYLSGLRAGAQSEDEKAATAKQIVDLTDGHPGLTQEVFEILERCGWRTDDAGWGTVKAKLAESEILDKLQVKLHEDAQGLAETAMEYDRPAYPAEYNSPRIQHLRQLGILRWKTESMAVLTGGVIGDRVRRVASAKRTERLGTVLTLSGVSRFEAGELVVTDDDFVVVQISDIHVGDEHAYRLAWRGGGHAEGTDTMHDVLMRDIEQLGLRSRVDALVVSGDVVCTANAAEYERAGEVLDEILKSLGIGSERLVLVPGNHDINWKPDRFSRVEPGRKVSRETFETFARRFGKDMSQGAELTPIWSRNGKHRLRLLALDSNAVEGPEAAGIGYVSLDSLKTADQLLRSDNAALEPETPKPHTWCVVHHHVYPVCSTPLAESRQARVSVMGNATELLDRLGIWNVEMLMHGHQHQPSLVRAQRWRHDVPDEWPSLIILGAGSVGASRSVLGPVSRNHYFIAIRRPESTVVRSRLMGIEGMKFGSHSDFVVSMT